MVEVDWPDDTLEQLDRIAAYIEVFDPIAAADIAGRLLALGNSLADFPRRGRPAADGTRELVGVRPYILQYDVTGDRVTIVAIRHNAQASPDRRS